MGRLVRQLIGFQECPQGSVLGTLLVVFYISELFYIARNYIAGYADDTTIYEVIL